MYTNHYQSGILTQQEPTRNLTNQNTCGLDFKISINFFGTWLWPASVPGPAVLPYVR